MAICNERVRLVDGKSPEKLINNVHKLFDPRSVGIYRSAHCLSLWVLIVIYFVDVFDARCVIFSCSGLCDVFANDQLIPTFVTVYGCLWVTWPVLRNLAIRFPTRIYVQSESARSASISSLSLSPLKASTRIDSPTHVSPFATCTPYPSGTCIYKFSLFNPLFLALLFALLSHPPVYLIRKFITNKFLNHDEQKQLQPFIKTTPSSQLDVNRQLPCLFFPWPLALGHVGLRRFTEPEKNALFDFFN